MEFSFDLNVGALLSPVALLVLAYLLKRTRDAITGHQDQKNAEVIAHVDAQLAEGRELADVRHRDNVARFDRIEIQTTATNGKLAEHDSQITALAAQNELLIRLFPAQPDKGVKQ